MSHTNHMNERQLEFLKVLKRRNYPLAFREDAANEDIISVMQGKLANTVVLPRVKSHNYPLLIFKDKEIHVQQTEEELAELD